MGRRYHPAEAGSGDRHPVSSGQAFRPMYQKGRSEVMMEAMVAISSVRSSADRKQSRSGQQTRIRIIEATLQTILDEGLVGTSARAIARAGDFNQALVFYHFGSIEELLLEALEYANERRLNRFGPALDRAVTLGELLDVVERLFGPRAGADSAAVAAIIGGWPANSDVGCRIVEMLQPWEDTVEAAVARCLKGTRLADLLPTDDMTYLISSMGYGVEMMRRIHPTDGRAESVMASLRAVDRNS